MIVSSLHEHASRRPTDPAISDGEFTLSYRQLSERVNTFARWLIEEEISTLGFQLENGINWVICDLAAIQAGISIVPIPTFFTDAQVIHVLDNAEIDYFIPGNGLTVPGLTVRGKSVSPPSGWQSTTPLGLAGLEGFRNLKKELTARLSADRTPIARKITYTSGSTGEPKGVCLAQETINTVVNSIVSAMEAIDIKRHLCVLPLATLLENIAGLYAPLIKGIEVIAPDSNIIGLTGSSKLDVDQFASAFETYKPDSVILVPQLLMALTTLAEFKMVTPSYLKMIAVGGGRVSAQLIDQAEAIGLPVFEGYGLSECCSVLTLNTPDAKRKGSVGKPLPHTQIRVNANGELEARGAVMSGYLGEEPMKSSNDKDGKWFHTGDLGTIDDDGFVFVNGRSKNLFITSYGRNVNPEWVESELTQQPAISQVLLYGEGCDHNLALVWPRFAAATDDIQALVNKSNEHLPDYARVHHFILMEDELPETLTTRNGRLKRADVIKQYQSLIDAHYASENSRAPEHSIEERLTREHLSQEPLNQEQSTHKQSGDTNAVL